jgi:hypothetical protein
MEFQAYWSILLKELPVVFREPPRCILDITDKSKRGGTWLPGSVLNIAECCLQPSRHPRKDDDSLAVIWRDEGCDSKLHCMTLKELRERVMYDPIFLLYLYNDMQLRFHLSET